MNELNSKKLNETSCNETSQNLYYSILSKQSWAVGTLKVPPAIVPVLGKKCTDSTSIRYYFDKVVWYFAGTGIFCTSDSVASVFLPML